MKTELNTDEMKALLPKIQHVLETGEPWEDEEFHFPAGTIIKAVSSIKGVTEKDRFESNGWEWDWWKTFSYNGKEYTLSGSGYYGGHRFGLSD